MIKNIVFNKLKLRYYLSPDSFPVALEAPDVDMVYVVVLL